MMQHIVDLLAWSDWQPLEGAWRTTTIPALPGLYRICRQGREDLDYIGQTGEGDHNPQISPGHARGASTAA